MTHKIARSLGAWIAAGISSVAFSASMTVTFAPTSAGNAASVTASIAYAGVTAVNNGTQVVVCYDNTKLTFGAVTYANPPGETQPSQEQASGVLCVAPANRQILLNYVSLGGTWPSNPTASGTLAASGNLASITFTTANPFSSSTSVVATENTAAGANYALGTATGTLNAIVPTAPTVSALANATLTGGTGSVAVNVATTGTATASVALACSIPAGTAAFAVTSGATRTINAPATVGANAPAIGLSCTPQAAVQTATLTCTQTATPAPNPANLTATITCPAVIPAAITAVTAPGTVTLPTYTVGATPSSSSTGLSFNTTGGSSSLSCVASGAGYTATPNPLNLVVGTAGVVTVTYTGAVVGTFAGTLTCTAAAPATGGPFVYTLSTTVAAAPLVGPAINVPTIGALGLGLMSLLIAGFAGFVQRRRGK